MIKYKCTDHKLDIACRNCIKAIIYERDLLLEFITIFSGFQITPQQVDIDFIIYQMKAKDLLKEIGEIE